MNEFRRNRELSRLFSGLAPTTRRKIPPMNVRPSSNEIKQPERPQLADAVGPGLITGASDDDPGGIATYSQAGAQLGYSLRWTLALTYPLACAICPCRQMRPNLLRLCRLLERLEFRAAAIAANGRSRAWCGS